MLNKLTGHELISLTRLGQMISTLNDELISEGFTDGNVIADLLVKATPFLAERAFTHGSN